MPFPFVNNVTNFALVTNSRYIRVTDCVDTESIFLLSLVTDTLLLLYLTAQLKSTQYKNADSSILKRSMCG